ncbi:methyl-accepting chemotaxis sensory transducer with TarH sensor [Duganella sp. CF402]|uniref:methyl-accepting chemotaxis protein n=1 Tax=unclassified Duganella TaxID=2636909 RepID=UPI0008D3E889|nr:MULTISPECIES: methyl-accepting chemotaxis protein [unclassified Duganella]RZT09730.1 methyl-accepting chemotaxis sensory transducer with TarH sensor [Duganella sp. BK701]SEL45302.1 methyl-accepting chemotaxis sensory transducer with TarH sensor [Duganella sp. CF402]
MLKNTSIKSRLIFVIGLLSLLMTAIGAISLFRLDAANATLKTVYDDRLIPVGQLDRVVRGLQNVQLNLQGGLQEADPAEARRQLAAADKAWQEYMATYLTPEETVLAQRFVVVRDAFLGRHVLPLLEGRQSEDTPHLRRDYEAVSEAVNRLIALQQTVAADDYAQSQQAFSQFRIVALVLLASGLAAGALVGVWLIRSITMPLDYAIELAQAVADGDLTREITVDTHNEMGKLLLALREMNHSLRQIVSQVRGGTDTIAAASSQIAGGNLDLSARTEQQASSLEETASAMEQLTATVRHNASHAQHATELAQSASEVAGRGGAVVAEVVSTMNAINEASRRIADITTVIDGLAFQTNILALNAAVEAARAGEQGRGFAVVASEVRTLAQRSGDAAREIKLLIEDSVGKVDAGSQLVAQAGDTMQDVVRSVQKVGGIISEISLASREQSEGIEQVNLAIMQMDTVTQQNAALVEEAAAAAAALSEQAAALSQAVGVFRTPAMPRAGGTAAYHATPRQRLRIVA